MLYRSPPSKLVRDKNYRADQEGFKVVMNGHVEPNDSLLYRSSQSIISPENAVVKFLSEIHSAQWKKMIMDVEVDQRISVVPSEDYLVKLDTPTIALASVIGDEYLIELMFLLMSQIEAGETPIASIPLLPLYSRETSFEVADPPEVQYDIKAGVQSIRAFHYNTKIEHIGGYVKTKCIYLHTFPFWKFSLEGEELQRYDLTINGVPKGLTKTLRYTFPHCPGDDITRNYTCLILVNSVFRVTKETHSKVGSIIHLEYVGSSL